MKILIANDDGIEARGIHELAAALSPYAEVYISAPHVQRSASGHSISVGKPIKIREVPFENACKALEVTGTPADCVKLGLKFMRNCGIPIDMVYSGINHGGNLGTDTLYSGTVSAAIEGVLCGLPAVAVSVNNHHPVCFDYACDIAVKTLKAAADKLPKTTALNINVPNVAYKDVKGLKYTRLGIRQYDEWFEPRENSNGEREYWYKGDPVVYKSNNEDIDVIAMQNGYASITPLKFNLTDFDMIEEIKKWRIGDE